MDLFFIHDIPVRILQDPALIDIGYRFHTILQYRPGLLNKARLPGHILIHVQDNLLALLDELTKLVTPKPIRITIVADKQLDTQGAFKQYFKSMRSAGGIVRKEDCCLMIYRSRRWDLPKGGIEQGETVEEAAVREVYEECGVVARPQGLFHVTWHAFRLHNTPILKETVWYVMDCIDDSRLAPQQEEGIKQVAWIKPTQCENTLRRTYKSIQLLLYAYHNTVGTFLYPEQTATT